MTTDGSPGPLPPPASPQHPPCAVSLRRPVRSPCIQASARRRLPHSAASLAASPRATGLGGGGTERPRLSSGRGGDRPHHPWLRRRVRPARCGRAGPPGRRARTYLKRWLDVERHQLLAGRGRGDQREPRGAPAALAPSDPPHSRFA